MKDHFELLGSDGIEQEPWFPYNERTASRYITAGIFHIHDVINGSKRMSYRGSSFVRYQIKNKLKLKKTTLSNETIGKWLYDACGEDDQYLINEIKTGLELNEIILNFYKKIAEQKLSD